MYDNVTLTAEFGIVVMHVLCRQVSLYIKRKNTRAKGSSQLLAHLVKQERRALDM